jgi:hypothetical protein
MVGGLEITNFDLALLLSTSSCSFNTGSYCYAYGFSQVVLLTGSSVS